ncbi:MAG: chemotaxis protein CheA [Thermodesulfobacteriota bacterium]
MKPEHDIHRQAFKDEALELLAELETSLLEWEERPEDAELLGRIFRAIHTIKGSGSMFGFKDIADFTHEAETLLDLARAGKVRVSKEMIDLTLAARDQVKAMIDAADGGEPVDEGRTAELMKAFQRLQIQARPPEAGGGESSPASPPPATAPAVGRMETITYRLRFRPREDVFCTGANPLLLLRELEELGQATIAAHLEDIPLLDSYDPEACYTHWDVILSTDQGLNAIKDVFIFVEDDCDLHIEIIDDGGRLDIETGYKRLGEILIEKGDLSPDDLAKVLKVRPRVGEMLVEAGVISPEQVQSALVEQRHVQEVREKRQKAVEITSLRVPSERLDKLVDLVGEMVTVQARLSQVAARRKDPELLSVAEEVERLTSELRDNAMSTRMVPIGTLFNKFGRLVRDLSQALGKEVELVSEGAETELDKTVIERLNDPLVHLLRNSIDHGLEPPEARLAAGKPSKGIMRVAAAHSGATVLISVNDDGAGLDAGRIRAKAVERGLIGPESDLSENELFNLIFHPGFSTAEKVTGVSGRGVGMDVVKKNIESLKGGIEISSRKGLGTQVVLKLPLTLAIIDGLLVTVGGDFFVFPISDIEECVELTPADVAGSHGRRTVTVRRQLVPYLRLRERFSVTGRALDLEQVVICSVDGLRLGFVVDRVVGQYQTVIKSLGRLFTSVTDISGATILGDGSVALIIDVKRIIQNL